MNGLYGKLDEINKLKEENKKIEELHRYRNRWIERMMAM
jgi:hypothetical protein